MISETLAPQIAFERQSGVASRFVVAIPAKNEEDRLSSCLLAFGRQSNLDAHELGIVIALNNTTDRSLQVCIDVVQHLPCSVTVLDETLELQRAHAGWARKLAMDEAHRRCAVKGLMLTTDADTVVDDDWVAQNLKEIEAGADAVAGFVTAEPSELQRLDAAILDRGALEWEYQNLLATYEALIDPRSWDPAPRHNQMCGASLALRREAYAAVGGLPPLPVGEDRALFQALIERDYRIRHSLKAHVTTSARTIGRAQGGMADALRLRHDPDYPCDDILETVDRATFRWKMRHVLRVTWDHWNISAVAADLGVSPEIVNKAALAPAFGRAWAMLQSACPSLAIDLVTSHILPQELDRLRSICSQAVNG